MFGFILSLSILLMFWSVRSATRKVCVAIQNLNRIVVTVLFRASEFSHCPFIISVGSYLE